MMIKLDFALAVGLYLLILLGFVFCCWLFLKGRELFKGFLVLSPRFIWCCNICTYTYFTTHRTEISVCPCCGSYNKYPESSRAAGILAEGKGAGSQAKSSSANMKQVGGFRLGLNSNTSFSN